MRRRGKNRQRAATHRKNSPIFGILTGIAGFFFLLTCSVVLVLNFRPLYYYDVQSLHLSEETGLSEETICRNYDVLIDYNLFWKGEDTLTFPDFPMSEQGRIHFREVKRIFVALQYGIIVMLILFTGGIIWNVRRRSFGFLRATAVTSLVIPALLGVLVAMNWERFFIGFHKLMFSNDYWLFDPARDPVIMILPDEFFFHCAAAVIVCLAAGGIFCEMVYRAVRRKEYTYTKTMEDGK